MISVFIENTKEYMDSLTKVERKSRGQFFTSKETAKFMADMFSLDAISGTVRLLDPGAGTGILSCALLERLFKKDSIKKICLDCYETDDSVVPVLEKNLSYAKSIATKEFAYRILQDDYIVSQAGGFENNEGSGEYDLVIGNPPYLRIPRNHPAATSMPSVVHGAPNLYFLFASMSLFNIKHGGEMVYIIPRSWTSGAYFKRFREYLFCNGTIEHIHLFVSRDKVFEQEQVLQETMIMKVRKGQHETSSITISSSKSNSDFNNISAITIDRDLVIAGEDSYVFLPTSEAEVETLKKINLFNDTFPSCGIRMRTGVVVDFRQFNELRKSPDDESVPLFYSQHIRNGRVNHLDSGKEYDWISSRKRGLIQENKNYVFCKRFTAKEERRRLQCGIYLAKDFPSYSSIGTQNKINYVDNLDGSCLTENMVYGIYAILNSTLYDRYYRILNGSTQVNSTEINSMPVPCRNTIQTLGEYLIKEDSLTTETCDRIMENVING